MKTTSLRLAALAFIASAAYFAGTGSAAADAVYVHIGPGGPPPAVVEHPWHRPYAGAVWIAGHHEWINGQYRWIGGYYDYPPHHGWVWIPARYVHHHDGYYYRPGYWAKP